MKYVICLIILLTAPKLFADPTVPSIKFKTMLTSSNLAQLAEARGEAALKILKEELKSLTEAAPAKIVQQSKRLRVKADALSNNTMVLKVLMQKLLLKNQREKK